MNAKQKTVHGRGLSNLHLGIFVCSLDVCRASNQSPPLTMVLRAWTKGKCLAFNNIKHCLVTKHANVEVICQKG